MAFLQVVPGLRIAAPRDAVTLRSLLREAVDVDDAPTVVRFPKGAVGADIVAVDQVGGVDVLRRGESPDVLLVSVGSMAETALEVAGRCAQQGIEVTVVDPRWVKPVNDEIVRLAREHRLVVTVEDGIRTGGVGAAVAQALRDSGVPTPLRDFGVPPRFLDHAKRSEVLADIGLTAQDIARHVVETVSSVQGRLEQQAVRD
jgi:1-deoxy-D-xylulose-5-phosphate synthase